MHRPSVRRPCATYGSLNGSQAQIAHRCLEPELPGEGERERRIRFGTLRGVINSKVEISLCRKDLSFPRGCTLVTKATFPLGLMNPIPLPAVVLHQPATFLLSYLGEKKDTKFISSHFFLRNIIGRDFYAFSRGKIITS